MVINILHIFCNLVNFIYWWKFMDGVHHRFL
ncbi:hypothetical protein MPLSOD_40260 [Mesorhizobium sp. SOD10]|nr:hypothetical protein MPLSOD_40260 [Mesorhizobium sp. SOD10]